MYAIVKQSKIDDNGNTIGTESTNQLFDTRAYEIEFIDGTTETLASNIISENLLAQIYEEGHRQLLLDEIINYRRNNDAVHKSDAFVDTSTGNMRQNMITKANFACWIPYAERKKKAIIPKFKSNFWQITHKYGIKIPKSVNEAYEFDEEN